MHVVWQREALPRARRERVTIVDELSDTAWSLLSEMSVNEHRYRPRVCPTATYHYSLTSVARISALNEVDAQREITIVFVAYFS